MMVGAGSAAAPGDAPALQINWSVNGGPINEAFPVGASNGDGSYTYEGVIVDDDTGLALSFDLTGNPSSQLSGNLSLENDLEETIEVSAEVLMPRSGPLPEGSLMAAVCVVGLTTDPGGGQLSSRPPWLWQALADGSVVGPSASLFADPFFIAHSGPASSGTSADFGNPDPVAGPPVISSFGFQIQFTLTSFDRASITSAFTAAGEFTMCDGDLDGDGEVGIKDLADMLATWGSCPPAPEPCPGDLDGDASVGVTDFLDLLAFWGPCP
jgi:hypothetical protein